MRGNRGSRGLRSRGCHLALVAVFFGALLAVPDGAIARVPKLRFSPPGQIQLVTINAEEMMKLSADPKARLHRLVHALVTRPSAFDGGLAGSVFSPDVIVTQEMRAKNLHLFAKLLNRRVGNSYQVVGLTDTAAEFLIDTKTIATNGPVIESPDSCDGALGGKRLSTRFYDIGQFTEKATDTNFAVAGVHLSHQYDKTAQPMCYERNIIQLRTELETLSPPVFIAGDFNRRAVQEQHECDPNETSGPAAWWLAMTAPATGRAYVDSVQSFVKSEGRSMAGEWTQKQLDKRRICNGTWARRRSRIDYIFENGAIVAQAHVDPLLPRATSYSDHRFVWGRYVIAGPPTPHAPTASARAGGVIHVEWQPDSSAEQWLVYRALGDHPYRLLDKLPPGVTSLDDSATDDGDVYRYSVAAVGPSGGQSAESRPARARADASGPDVRRLDPYPGARKVPVDHTIDAILTERPDRSSVTAATISVTDLSTGRQIPGTLTQLSPTHLSWAPERPPLHKATTYRVVVSRLRDGLGNAGLRYVARFRTVAPPKHHRHKHHRHAQRG